MVILFTILFGLLAYILWERRHLYKLSWQLPGPIGLPILGNAFTIASPKNVIPYLDNVTQKYGSPIRLWVGPQLIVLISDAINAEIVLKSKHCLNKPYDFYKAIRDALNVDGFFTLEADEWKVHRRLVSPTINLSTVSAHLPIFNDNIRKMVDNLPDNGEYIDILKPLTVCKITMFVEAALGFGWDPEVKQRYLKQFAEGIEIVAKRILQPLYHFDFLWNKTDYARRLIEYNQYGHDLFAKILKEKLETGAAGDSFLERLLRVSLENPKFTFDDVLAETATILTGATDTSSTASGFVALMLALHPDHQEKVFQEILSVFPEKDSEITQDDLDKLEFTDLCIRETLRLFPTAPIIGRVATKPIKLANDVVIPPDVPIVFGLRQIHLREEYFGPTAKMFDPYRFTDEKIKQLPPAAYIPFSYGARNCIGYFYAKVSVKCFIVHLIRNYRLSTPYKNIDELRLVLNVSMRIVDKHMIKFERRT